MYCPTGDPQEVQAGDTVYIAPEYASGQVQLYYEGVPAEESSMTGMRFGDSNFYRVGNSLYFYGCGGFLKSRRRTLQQQLSGR